MIPPEVLRRLCEAGAPLDAGSLKQGAYTPSLIPPFNGRERPAAVALGC